MPGSTRTPFRNRKPAMTPKSDTDRILANKRKERERKERAVELGLKDGGYIRVTKPRTNKPNKGSFGHNY